MKMKQEEKIKEIIETLRPFLISDGGDIEYVKYEDHIVYVKLSGACANCMLVDYSIQDGIEAAIKEEVPEVEGVVQVTE